MNRVLRLLLVLLVALPVLAAEPAKVTTVILVRHAEKAGPTGDVPLSETGHARAKELARVLAGANVTAVLSTPYDRTRSTAKPLAEAMGLQVVETPAGKTYPQDVVAKIKKEHAGGTVVVVGHSNTTVDVLKELGISDAKPIADSQYDDLYIVTIGEGIAPKVVAIRYGAVAR